MRLFCYNFGLVNFLRGFFEINEPVIRFGYGLAFFSMGLAIAFQSRSSSRLGLARSLAWLAAFGVLNSLYEWGELFSPVHEPYLTARGVEFLHFAHLTFLSLSYICLVQFGISLLQPRGHGLWIRQIPLLMLGGYFILLVSLPRLLPDPHTWHAVANATARYFICFPGGVLAAYGLRAQTFRHIAPLEAPDIVKTLRISGITLFLYAIVGGLIPPYIPYFPGNLINTDSFSQFFGVPPLVFESIIGLTLAISIIRATEIFGVEVERLIERMEQLQILAAERARIARELHDSTIQTAYSAGLLVDSARKLAEPESQISGRLEKAIGALNEVIHDLRRNLGELRSVPTNESLPDTLRALAEDRRYGSLVDISIDLKIDHPEQISPTQKDHITAITNEALANVVRHAHARKVKISAHQNGDRLEVIILDDGIGLVKGRQEGFGLRNMEERARILGGRLEVTSEKGRGTQVALNIPVRENR